MPALKTITHNGQKYFIDFRLQELRDTKMYFNVIRFTDIESERLKGRIRKLRALHYDLYYMPGIDD